VTTKRYPTVLRTRSRDDLSHPESLKTFESRRYKGRGRSLAANSAAAKRRFQLSLDSPRLITKFERKTSNGGWSCKGGRLPRCVSKAGSEKFYDAELCRGEKKGSEQIGGRKSRGASGSRCFAQFAQFRQCKMCVGRAAVHYKLLLPGLGKP